MKKIFAWILSALLVLSLPVFVLAAETELPKVIDDAALLTSEEEASLAETVEVLTDTYGMDIVILTVPSLNGMSAQQYADDYYDDHGYADDGILLLLAMEEREWYFSTCGDAIFVFTDYGVDRMGETILPYLSSGDYYLAFAVWLETLPEYFDSFLREEPVDSPEYYRPDNRDDVVYYDQDYKETSSVNFFVAPLVGVIAAAITILIMRGQMNTARRQGGAAEYMKQNSYRLTVQRDIFLYSQISKTPKPKNNSTSGGGSSVHMGGGGRSHGGGGRF